MTTYAIVHVLLGTILCTKEDVSPEAALDAFVALDGYSSYEEYCLPCGGERVHAAVAAWVEPEPFNPNAPLWD